MPEQQQEERPFYELLPSTELKAMGAPDEQINQGNMLAVKQSPVFPLAAGMISLTLSRRGEQLMLDYSAQGVGVRVQIDGMWMNSDPLDRQSGDAMLAVFKKLANLNVQDRKSRQDGTIGAEFNGGKYFCDFTSQGVQTGERVLIKIRPKKPKFENILELGIREKMREQFKECLDSPPGLVLISAPPGGGLTTTWAMALSTADRFVQDFVSLEDKGDPEEEVINVGPQYYDKAAGETPADLIPKLMLKEPDALVIPDPTNAETLELLCEQINDHNKLGVTRVQAKDSIEAVARLLSYKGPTEAIAKALRCVLNVRLARRLCESCKQAFQPPPQLLQKLGIPQGRISVLYQEFRRPPPEQCVDEKGKPIEIPVCQDCGGIGYRDRFGIFELLMVDDKLREAMVKQPKVDTLRSVARASGHRGLQEEGILQVAQGVTSVQELQRALKQ